MSSGFSRRAVTASLAALALLVTAPAGLAKSPKPAAPGTPAVAFQYPIPRPVASRAGIPVATEAPDGVVFFASGTAVYRIGDDGTTLAKQIKDRIYAIAASDALLVVETPTDVFAYSRLTGKRVADWYVEAPGAYPPYLLMSGDVIWSMTDPAYVGGGLEPATVRELRVGHQPRKVTDQASPVTPVVDGEGGVFFVTFGGRIEGVNASGATRRSPASSFGTAVLAYTEGKVIAEIDGGSTVVDELDPATLSVVSTSKGTIGDFADTASTTIGLLSLDIECSSTYLCSNIHLRHITLPDTRSGALSVPYGGIVMGPQPRVLELPAKGKPVLIGLRLT